MHCGILAAQMTAAVSIGLASCLLGCPSPQPRPRAVAGTMVVDGGGLQRQTVTSITDGVGIYFTGGNFLSGGLYWIAFQLI